MWCCTGRVFHEVLSNHSEPLTEDPNPQRDHSTSCVQVLRSPKSAFAVAMQSWRERCEKYVCLQGDCVEKLLHFQLPVVSSFLCKLGDLRTWTPHVTRHSAFFELSHPRTHIFHVHNAITASLTQLSMNFGWFHATQVEESDNHTLFFKCKRRHFSIKNTTATRPHYKHSTGSTVLPLGLVQPKEQPRLLQQLSCFYLLPFPEKKN